jgi:two-component system sensor histidine kinase and response regulator WspE
MNADLSQTPMFELFRLDAEGQVQALTTGLLALERAPNAESHLEACMRAAHSLKGAARIVGVQAGVAIAHVMEECFVAAQRGTLVLRQDQIDELLRGVDLLKRITLISELGVERWEQDNAGAVAAFIARLEHVLLGGEAPQHHLVPNPLAASQTLPIAAPVAPPPRSPSAPIDAIGVTPTIDAKAATPSAGAGRFLRVTAENLNCILGLAAESLVDARWLPPFSAELLQLKHMQQELSRKLDRLRDTLTDRQLDEQTQAALLEAQLQAGECRRLLGERLVDLELFDRRSTHLAHRLYEAALACRMRPFADGVQAYPRLVRDTSHALAKQVRLDIAGQATLVDRDILEKLDAPLGHLLRNAIDHGIESAQQRVAAGKPAEGTIRLDACHSGGLLQVLVADDGAGIDCEQLRGAIVQRQMAHPDTASRLSKAELLEFLFLPGFTMKESVTEVSGRGVGLDVVQDMLKQVRGTVKVTSQLGEGTRFLLQLPLTLSVVRTLLVDISCEPYAFPLANIVRTVKLPRTDIGQLEGRQFFEFEGEAVGLVAAHQVLALAMPPLGGQEWPVVVVGEAGGRYGLVVDRFLGERELVIHPLDRRLGKVKDIAAGALMEDGAPVLIVDVADILRSVEKLVLAGHVHGVPRAPGATDAAKRKRILVVDDSLTVRELERKLLTGSGYEVEVAIDGSDGWNTVRTGEFDLVITDIDMPRMDGIELVKLIKNDARLRPVTVMIVSYKDRAEDRLRGLDAGADYYLAKGSFHDDTLLQAVFDLVGAALA